MQARQLLRNVTLSKFDVAIRPLITDGSQCSGDKESVYLYFGVVSVNPHLNIQEVSVTEGSNYDLCTHDEVANVNLETETPMDPALLKYTPPQFLLKFPVYFYLTYLSQRRNLL